MCGGSKMAANSLVLLPKRGRLHSSPLDNELAQFISQGSQRNRTNRIHTHTYLCVCVCV